MNGRKGLTIALALLLLAAITWPLAQCGYRSGDERPSLRDPDAIRLYVLDGGATRIADLSGFSPEYAGRGPMELEVRSFLVVHPRGTLLWDTGHSDSYRDETGGWKKEGGMEVRVTRGLQTQLDALCIAPSDVDYLAFSHWHFDHTGNAGLFAGPATTIIGQRDEYELAFSPGARTTFGMHPRTYEALRENPTDLFLGDRDVFGDGSVIIMRVAGHTIGSQVLWVKLARHRPILLSGDLYHFAEQREHRRVPAFNHSTEDTLGGIERVEAFLAAHPETRLWITHDPAQMGAVALAPAFYD